MQSLLPTPPLFLSFTAGISVSNAHWIIDIPFGSRHDAVMKILFLQIRQPFLQSTQLLRNLMHATIVKIFCSVVLNQYSFRQFVFRTIIPAMLFLLFIQAAHAGDDKVIATQLLNNAFKVYKIKGKVVKLAIRESGSDTYRMCGGVRASTLEGTAKVSINNQEETIWFDIRCYHESVEYDWAGRVFLEATDLLANAFQNSPVNGAVIEKEYYRWKTVELTIPISFDASEQHKHKLK